jgi:Protein of unknown function (DUF1659).
MAVESIKGGTKLALTVIAGVDAKGNDIKKAMNFSKIKPTAADENLFATAKAVEPLLRYPVVMIEKNDSYLLAQV